MRVHARVLVLLLLSPVVAGGQTISGNVFDIMGTPLQGIPVAYNLGGNVQRDTTDVGGSYLLSFGTSDVPDDDPVVQVTSWGQMKARFREATPVRGRSTDPVADVSPDTLHIYGEELHWSVHHFIGTWEGSYTFNAALCPRVWTVPGYFSNISMEVPVIKHALFVGDDPGQMYLDNLHWPSSAYPIPVDGTNFTQANQNLLAARSQDFANGAGISMPFAYVQGGAQRFINGVWVIFNGPGEARTEMYCDVNTYELFAATIHVRDSDWNSPEVSEKELFRALGLAAPDDFDDPRYGITNASPTPFTSYDAALIRFMVEKQKRNEEGKNSALLHEMH